VLGQLADLVVCLDRQAPGQVAFAFGDVPEQVGAGPDGGQDPSGDEEGHADADDEEDQGGQPDHPAHFVNRRQDFLRQTPDGHGPPRALDGGEAEDAFLAHEGVLLETGLAFGHALEHLGHIDEIRVALAFLDEVALVQDELAVGVGDGGPLVVDDVGIAVLAVFDAVGDVAQQVRVQAGHEHGPNLGGIVRDRGRDHDDRHVRHFADDDA
jgi:hypothetical protein